MDRANQDNRWLRQQLADAHSVRVTPSVDPDTGEIRDDAGGLIGRAPRCGTPYLLECAEAALVDSERQHRAACDREEYWKRRAERCELALFIVGLAVIVGLGGWIAAKF